MEGACRPHIAEEPSRATLSYGEDTRVGDGGGMEDPEVVAGGEGVEVAACIPSGHLVLYFFPFSCPVAMAVCGVK